MRSEPDQRPFAEIAEKYGFSLIVLFGSRAVGRHTESSDYDCGVWFANYAAVRETGTASLHRALFTDLAEAIGSRRLHLAILNQATPLLLWEAATKGRPLYCRNPEDWNTLRVIAAKKHWDNRPLYEAEKRYLENRYGGAE